MTKTLLEMVARARATAREISTADARDAVVAGDFAVVVDVREPGEFGELHISGATCIPRGLLELRADPASPSADAALAGSQSARVLVYCTKAPGARSLLAAETLAAMGFEQVEVLAGGLNAWSEAGLPVDGAATTPGTP
jgi:rhodanese-related sulfurtransferase